MYMVLIYPKPNTYPEYSMLDFFIPAPDTNAVALVPPSNKVVFPPLKG